MEISQAQGWNVKYCYYYIDIDFESLVSEKLMSKERGNRKKNEGKGGGTRVHVDKWCHQNGLWISNCHPSHVNFVIAFFIHYFEFNVFLGRTLFYVEPLSYAVVF